MSAPPFLAAFGFTADPFEFTNADEEPELAAYFVPPPYFATILGDPSRPRSHVVLAPRGGGKTAQRRMIEGESEAGTFLCVTYDLFDQPATFRVSGATLDYHINQICRLMVIGILVKVEAEPELVTRLSARQKELLKLGTTRFLGHLSMKEFDDAVRALKNFGDKAHDFWQKYGGPIAIAVNVILKKVGLDKVDIPPELVHESKLDASLPYYFRELLTIVTTLGFSSTYVLVDKVDELALTTGDAKAAYEFVRPLITDLPTLETAGVGFKFFLWEQIGPSYTAHSRPDRVPVYELRWKVDELENMLTQRLAVYSRQRIHSFNVLLCGGSGINLHRLLAYLANGSPRDMIRIASRIVAEQTRMDGGQPCVTEAAVWAGVRQFSEDRVAELFGAVAREVAKIVKPTFTINHLASDVLRVSTQAARQRVQNWTNTGIVKKVGELPNRGQRPLHLFAVTDVRTMIAMAPETDVPLLLGNYAIVCPDCGTVCLTDQQLIDCTGCSHQFDLAKGISLLEVCNLQG